MKEKELVLFMESVHISPVADPGGGARKAPPVYLKTKDRMAEKNFFFGDQPHPAYLGVWNDRPPYPRPPPPTLSQGLDPPLFSMNLPLRTRGKFMLANFR